MRRRTSASNDRSISLLHLVIGEAEPDSESDFGDDGYHCVAATQLCEAQQKELRNHNEAEQDQEHPDRGVRDRVREDALGYRKEMVRYR